MKTHKQQDEQNRNILSSWKTKSYNDAGDIYNNEELTLL